MTHHLSHPLRLSLPCSWKDSRSSPDTRHGAQPAHGMAHCQRPCHHLTTFITITHSGHHLCLGGTCPLCPSSTTRQALMLLPPLETSMLPRYPPSQTQSLQAHNSLPCICLNSVQATAPCPPSTRHVLDGRSLPRLGLYGCPQPRPSPPPTPRSSLGTSPTPLSSPELPSRTSVCGAPTTQVGAQPSMGHLT